MNLQDQVLVIRKINKLQNTTYKIVKIIIVMTFFFSNVRLFKYKLS